MAIQIKKEPSGTYTVRVWAKSLDVFGKRKTKYKSGIKSVAAARNWGAITESEISEQSQIQQDVTFQQLNTYYMDAKQNKMSPTTLEGLKTILPRVL